MLLTRKNLDFQRTTAVLIYCIYSALSPRHFFLLNNHKFMYTAQFLSTYSNTFTKQRRTHTKLLPFFLFRLILFKLGTFLQCHMRTITHILHHGFKFPAALNRTTRTFLSGTFQVPVTLLQIVCTCVQLSFASQHVI